MKVQAVQLFSLANYSAGIRPLKFLVDGFGDERFDMGYAYLTQKLNLYLVTVQQQNNFLKLYVKQLQKVGALINDCTTVMKHCAVSS